MMSNLSFHNKYILDFEKIVDFHLRNCFIVVLEKKMSNNQTPSGASGTVVKQENEPRNELVSKLCLVCVL